MSNVTNLLVLLPTVGNCQNRSAGDAMHAETMAHVSMMRPIQSRAPNLSTATLLGTF